jgi:hypothetical protein
MMSKDGTSTVEGLTPGHGNSLFRWLQPHFNNLRFWCRDCTVIQVILK